MAISEEFNSYKFRVTMMTLTVLSISALATIVLVVLRLVFLRKLIKSMFRAALEMEACGRILKQVRLDPYILATIAVEKGDIEDKQIVEEYEKTFKNRIGLLARVFGIDKMTTDFVKLYDSKFVAKKKSKKGKKKKEFDI